MGVYIKGMSKPKRCGECELWSNCFYPKNPYTEQDDYIADDCPLIDIVTCGECKHWYNDADCGMACEFTNMGQPINGFCNWGERRAE